ncbi:MAG: GNAT family N-acetyltransferase [Saprospiraceae bacterium]|nr:GNAT family N-acetyltransferase [Saprospiraceae bacterium]
MSVIIRKAVASDLLSILELVKELAVYEQSGDQVLASLADYEEAFSDKVFDALVADENHLVVGAALYYLTWSTWRGRMYYLEDFIVSKDHRQKGIGQLLFDAFLNEAKEKKCALVKWQVLEWNQPALDFYKKNDATIERDWWNGKILFSQD